jgi:hypothetical protein
MGRLVLGQGFVLVLQLELVFELVGGSGTFVSELE